MIGYLNGVIKEVNKNSCIVDVNGVGYEVYCSRRTLSDIEGFNEDESTQVKLHTRLIHREDTLDLYGFLYKDEYNLFNLLITVSGIGPKQAIKILGTSRVPDIVHAIVYEDSAFLMRLSGIGKKKSQQIILELKEKLKESFDVTSVETSSHYIEAISALESLGFSRNESKEAVDKAMASLEDSKDVGKIVENALKNLS